MKNSLPLTKFLSRSHAVCFQHTKSIEASNEITSYRLRKFRTMKRVQKSHEWELDLKAYNLRSLMTFDVENDFMRM